MYVFLTVDVETYVGDYGRDVWGDGNGLDYLLSTLTAYHSKATFFVEALGATRWGREALKDVCSRILTSQQEIQLHLHPSLVVLDGFSDKCDLLCEQSLDTQRALMEMGLRILLECGVGAIAAMRAGDLAANEDTLLAMSEARIPISSNRDLDKNTTIYTRLNDVFPVRNDASRLRDIVDIPVSALRSPFPMFDGPYRHLEISAIGVQEMKDALRKMQRAGYSSAAILTHPQEFFMLHQNRVVPNMKNRRRLEKLISFIDSAPLLRFATLSEAQEHLPIPSQSPPELMLNPIYALMRMVSQGKARLRRHLLSHS